MVHFVTGLLLIAALYTAGGLSASLPVPFRIKNTLACAWLTLGHANAINHFWWLARTPSEAVNVMLTRFRSIPDWFVIGSWFAYMGCGVIAIFVGFSLANRKKDALRRVRKLLPSMFVIQLAWYAVLGSEKITHASLGPVAFYFIIGFVVFGGINLAVYNFYGSKNTESLWTRTGD